MQKVLTMTTSRNTMRAEVEGWGSEDGDAVRDYWAQRLNDPKATQYDRPNDMPVGLIGGSMGKYQVPFYPTVLHAIGDGWKLLAPPVEYTEKRSKCVDSVEVEYDLKVYEWWLVRD